MDLICELIDKLNKATEAYDNGTPIMTDKEWDNLYWRLIDLEQRYHIYPSESPSQSIHYNVVSKLNKVKHNHPMLSLDKTKNFDEFKDYFGERQAAFMLKLDGLTCSLQYKNGVLYKAETRGNGIEGEDVTHCAQVIPSIPLTIPYKDELVVDGEVIITAKDFEKFSSEYANPRNFVSGSIRLLDANECAKRKLTFLAWNVVKGLSDMPLFTDRLLELSNFGFAVVPYIIRPFLFHDGLSDNDISMLTKAAERYGYPIDGLVGRYNDVEYGEGLGSTSHHTKAAYAYKFYDEEVPTKLRYIEWSIGRTGVLTPIAIFDPIEIEGSTVERASLHNLSIMHDLFGDGGPYLGQEITVFKANQIIPQIKWADQTDVSNGVVRVKFTPPSVCPACGSHDVKVISNDNTEFLVCDNPQCEGKLINKLDHFCSKDSGLNIVGLSRKTLEKLILWGWVDNLSDIFLLKDHRGDWINKPGFGIKSVDNILTAIETSKVTTLESFISSLGIPLIGINMAKLLVKYVGSYEDLKEKVKENFDFSVIDGFAASKSLALNHFDYTEADKVYSFLSIKESPVIETTQIDSSLEDKKIAITGKLNFYKNRNLLKDEIEKHGGKVVDSVNKNTSMLINNDNTSNSAKNLSAKKLNIPIFTEQEFVEKFLTL